MESAFLGQEEGIERCHQQVCNPCVGLNHDTANENPKAHRSAIKALALDYVII